MARYTAKQLEKYIDQVNVWLESAGSTIRFETGGRNGYDAVDEYSVDADGVRIGSGVNRNVGCGTPKECSDYAECAYSDEYRRLKGPEHCDG
jgi:hypothetical protein